MTDLGGAFDKEENQFYPNCYTKFYFPEDLIYQNDEIDDTMKEQCEMYAIARTLQVCFMPCLKEDLL